MYKIKAFYEIRSFDFEIHLSDKIKKEIERKGKEYILGVDEDEFKNYLVNEYTLEPLHVYTESEEIEKPQKHKEVIEDRYFYGKCEADVYEFTVKYQFSGSSVLFKVQPNPYEITYAEINVGDNYFSFSFKLYSKNPEEFKRKKDNIFREATTNMKGVNAFASQWNQKLKGLVDTHFQQMKKKYMDENDFFAAINVKVNSDTNSLYVVPTIKKKIVPHPQIPKNQEFSTNPIIAQKTYEDILKVIYDFGKSMEKKPSTYQNKDEESLRDLFLLILETRYDAITATGETFNKSGKTDILLKYANDGTNVFVAECKFWHGASEFHKAISQLFDRYLTWRDSKVALVLFVTNNDFTNVIRIIKKETKLHPYYVKENGSRGDSSFSYIFHLPQDNNKDVYFEIIVLHFNK
jgi:hypothetical protein